MTVALRKQINRMTTDSYLDGSFAGGTLRTKYARIDMHGEWHGPVQLWSFHVVKEHRGQGHGTRLMEAVFEIARRRNFDLELFVLRNNERAIRLYESLGFVAVGGNGEGAIRMRKQMARQQAAA